MGAKKKPTDKTKSGKKSFGLKSIRMKLIVLGVAALASTLILGVLATLILNQNHRNSEILQSINEANRLQEQNSVLDVSFLYELDNQYNSQILENLKEMKNNLANAKEHAGKTYQSTLNDMDQKIDKNMQNMEQLVSLMDQRGFKEDQGLYANFMEGDKKLEEFFGRLGDEADWQDGSWEKKMLDQVETKKFDKKNYKVIHYNESLPSGGKRDNIVVRVCTEGQQYEGKIYLTNIKFDGSTEVDLSKQTADTLGNSFGTAYKDLDVGTLDGKPAISFSGTYSGSNASWQETSVVIPVSEYDIQNFSKISCDICLEENADNPEMQIAVATNGRFQFDEKQEAINTEFAEYSKLIAEGNDASKQLEQLTKDLEEVVNNTSIYIQNEEIGKLGQEGFQKKADALKEMQEVDTQIQTLKAENNANNEELTKDSNNIKKSVNEVSVKSQSQMKVSIMMVLIVAIVCVGILTIFVSRSIQASIRRFRGTLQEITDGNIKAKAATGRGDEFDVFGESLNQMTDQLSSTLGNVNEVAKVVQHGGSELKTMAEDTNQISGKMELSVTEIAEGAVSQAKDIEDSNNHVNHLGELMNQMVQDIEKLDNSSTDIETASNEAVNILDRLSDSNEKMTEGVRKIVEQIKETNESVEQIGEAVSLISSIASQTNLLSLNASIEAARAGEAGKGFAVVATEISQLADQSDQSADTIQNVIQKLSANFQQTMDMMRHVEESTREQNEKLLETQKQFHIVNDRISISRENTHDIKLAVEESNQVQEKVGQLMESLSAISEENAAASTETEEVMQRLNDTIKNLLAESEKMLDISNRLEQDLQFFQL
ncbi:MAG: methyl-accepting chemotaxis protein [Lachnospiraceae bacterium]